MIDAPDDLLRDLSRDLPFDQPSAARRDAVRSALLVEASEGARVQPAGRRWLTVGGAFTAGALAAAAIAVLLLRGDRAIELPAPSQITASSEAKLEHRVVATETGVDEIVEIHTGKVTLAVPPVRRGDHVRVRTSTAEVDGDAGELEILVVADALQAVTVRSGSARIVATGQAPVFLAAGQTWRSSVITTEITPEAPKVASAQPSKNTTDGAIGEPAAPPARGDTIVSQLPKATDDASKPTAAQPAKIANQPVTNQPKDATPATKIADTLDKPSANLTTKPGDKPSSTPAGKPSADLATKPGEKPGTNLAVKPGDKPNATPGEKPRAKLAVKPGDKPSSTPAAEQGKPGDKPSANLATKPGDKPSAKPDDKPSAKLGTTDRPSTTPDDKPSANLETKPATAQLAAIEKRFQVGWKLLRDGKAREAATELGAAADAAPDAPIAQDARYFQAVALVRAGDVAAAEKVLVQFLDRAPKSLRRGRAAVLLGRVLALRGDRASARAWFESATADPDPAIAAAARAGLQSLATK